MAEKSVAEKVEALAEPVLSGLGVELYELEYIKEGGYFILRVFIDKPGGVSIDDCERVSHALEAALDVSDPIEGPYTLEVSSPGIERALTRPFHFYRCMGKLVEVRLYKPMDGKRRFIGTLTGLEGDLITLSTQRGENGDTMSFERRAVSSCRLVFFRDADGGSPVNGGKKGGNRKNG